MHRPPQRVNCTFFAALAERSVCRSRARWPTRGAVLHLASQYGADPEGTDPTLSGATYDNATSPPVAGRVPGRRGDARSHGGPAGPAGPAGPCRTRGPRARHHSAGCPRAISTDGLKAYREAVDEAFGGDVDFAQIIYARRGCCPFRFVVVWT